MAKQQQVIFDDTGLGMARYINNDCFRAARLDFTSCLWENKQDYQDRIIALGNQMWIDCLALGPVDPYFDPTIGEIVCPNNGTLRGFDDQFLESEAYKYRLSGVPLVIGENPIIFSYGGCFTCNAWQIEGRPPLSETQCVECIWNFLDKVRELLYENYRGALRCKEAYERKIRNCRLFPSSVPGFGVGSPPMTRA